MPKVADIKSLGDYRLALTFDDGVQGEIDFSSFVSQGVFQAWDDRAFFETVSVGPLGELVWGEEIDLCPDALYMQITGKDVAEVFPSLSQEDAHA